MFEEEFEDKSRFQKFRSSKYFLPLVVLLVVVGATMFLLGSKPDVVEEKAEFPPLTVEVTRATMGEQLLSSQFQGEVRAKTDIELVTQVTGKVVSVSSKFIEGGHFEKDEVILQIDDADYRVALKSAEAAVAEAKVELGIEQASAETNKREWQNLVGESIEKADPLRLNKPQVQRARARLDAARAQLAQAKLDYDRTKISAPFAGRVMKKSAELGQFVSRGSSVGRVFSTDSVEIRIPMSDVQISELGLGLGQIQQQGQQIAARVSTVFGHDLHHWAGYLKSVDSSVDSETRLLFGTIVVESPFKDKKMPLAPGLFVDIELDAAQKVSGVSVPRIALRGGNKVYVVSDGELQFRDAKTLYTSLETAMLSVQGKGAVAPGDQVVISPVPGAYNGMSVKIRDDNEAQIKSTVDANEQDDAATTSTTAVSG